MAQQDITKEGPYIWTVVQGTTTCQRAQANGSSRPVQVPITVTTPAAATATSSVPPPPYPVCVLINGFQARASQYAPFAQRLASWGFLVVQYNAPALTIIPDAEELPWLGSVLQWVRQHSSSGAAGGSGADAVPAFPVLQGRADWSRCVIAGHSRGGKLAALHFSSSAPCDSTGWAGGKPLPAFKAAFLLDPVNNTDRTPVSPAYPDAVVALKAAGRPFGMACAGLIGPANPEGANWKVFQEAAAPASWRLLLPTAGHTTFSSPQATWERWLLDKCFGGGPMPRERLQSLTSAAMMSWFWNQLADSPEQQQQQQQADWKQGRTSGTSTTAAGGGGHGGGDGGHHGVVADNPMLQPVPLTATMPQPALAAAAATAVAEQAQERTAAAAAAAGHMSHDAWGLQLAADFLHKIGLVAGKQEVTGADFDLTVR